MTLSIITINFNNRDGLQKTIDSVLSQTWTDYEWIIIDGDSTDGSKELIEQYQKHFAYWCSEPDRGVYHAMNKGVAMANGEYLSFMNSGDIYYEAKTLQMLFNDDGDADVLYGDWIERYQDHETRNTISEGELTMRLWQQNICHQAMFIKRALLKQDKYDEAMNMLADWKWNTERVLEGKSFKYLPVIVCKYDMYGMSNQEHSQQKQKEISAVMSLYPTYMQCAVRELDNYHHDHDVQMLKELKECNRICSICVSWMLKCLFYMMLAARKIKAICNHKS